MTPVLVEPVEVAPLTKLECSILDAIESPADRYTAYVTPGKLAWGARLKVGDTVLARLPLKGGRGLSGDGSKEQQALYTTATLRWHGNIDDGAVDTGSSIMDTTVYLFGVEITVSVSS
jgi:hypothetical protein